MMVALRWWFAALTALMLAACGGGGGNGANSPDFAGELTAISVSPNNAGGDPIFVTLGQTQAFTATGTFTTPPGASQPTESRAISDVVWSSSDISVATIDSNGVLTAANLTPGTSTIQIRAAKNGVTSAPVLVRIVNAGSGPGVSLIRIDVAPQSSVINRGQTVLLSATGMFSDGTRPISVAWSSASPGIASVNPQVGTTTTVTGVAVGGPVVIQAAAVDNGQTFTATASVTVVQSQSQNVLVDLVITPANPSIQITQTQGFTATGRCSDGTIISNCAANGVTWTSSDPSVATVSPTAGPTTIATGLRAGATQIRASAPNPLGGTPITNFTILTVQGEPALLDIVITPANANVPLGRQQTYIVRGLFEDAPTTPRAIAPSRVTWSSSNPDVATVAPTNSDQTTAATRQVGTTSIFASVTRPGNSPVVRSVPLTVRAAEIESIVVVPVTASIPAGTTQTFEARGRSSNTPAGVTDPNLPLITDLAVTWTTSNPAVARFTDTAAGIAQSTRTGPTNVVLGVMASPTAVNITASVLTQSNVTVTGTAQLTVTDAVLQAVLRIEPETANVVIGATRQFRLIGRFTNSPATGSPIANFDANGQQQVIWMSSAPAIATVNNFGLATGVSKGQATITATLATGTFPGVTPRSATAILNVTDEICITPVRAVPGQFFPNAQEFIDGLCLLCNVMNPANVIDTNPQTVTRIDVPVGLLLAGAALRVNLEPAPLFSPPLRPNPLVDRGPGFLLVQPPGLLAEAELLSQIVLRTLVNGVQIQSSQEQGNTLRLDLLGTTLLGDRELGFVSFPATFPFNQLELRLNSGVVTALNTLFVGDACLETRLPLPTP